MRPCKQFLITFALFYLFYSNARSQGTFVLRNDVPVVENGETLKNPWAGGLNCPQFSMIDCDNDGMKEIFVFDRTENSILTFKNAGSAAVPDYRFAPEFINLFPDSLQEWVLLRDYDGDGYEDIWTLSTGSYVKVYHNDAATNGGIPHFTLRYDPLLTRYYPNLLLNLYSGRSDVPVIMDVDYDGDLDFLTFEVLGVAVEFHKNIAVDSGWGLDTIALIEASYCFGHFQETNCGANLVAPCLGGMKTAPTQDQITNRDGSRHTGSAFVGLDLNQDSLYDLIIGDIGCSRLYALYSGSGGTLQAANYDSVELNYPNNGIEYKVDTFAAPFYLDVDGDNIRDLIVSPNYPSVSEDRRNVSFYHNAGLDNNPLFQLTETDWLQHGMIDVGTGSTSAFFDYNMDGLLDLLFANKKQLSGDSGKANCSFYLYENTGTISTPAFELIDTNYLGFLTLPQYNFASELVPAFGDLDADGDPDLLIGKWDGTIYYFKNSGGTGIANFTQIADTFENIDVGTSAAPNLYDLNNDGDLDLIIGNSKGRIWYYKNSGTANVYQFDSITSTFGNIKINDFSGNPLSLGFSKPMIADYDHDGQPEILIGTLEGQVQIYDNVSLNPGATFTHPGNFFNDYDFGYYSSISGALLDTSSNFTYLVGSLKGGFRMVGISPLPTSIDNPTRQPISLVIFPNPASKEFTLEMKETNSSGKSCMRIFSIQGEEMMHQEFSGQTLNVNTAALDAGIYLVKVETSKGQAIKKLVIW